MQTLCCKISGKRCRPECFCEKTFPLRMRNPAGLVSQTARLATVNGRFMTRNLAVFESNWQSGLCKALCLVLQGGDFAA